MNLISETGNYLDQIQLVLCIYDKFQIFTNFFNKLISMMVYFHIKWFNFIIQYLKLFLYIDYPITSSIRSLNRLIEIYIKILWNIFQMGGVFNVTFLVIPNNFMFVINIYIFRFQKFEFALKRTLGYQIGNIIFLVRIFYGLNLFWWFM